MVEGQASLCPYSQSIAIPGSHAIDIPSSHAIAIPESQLILRPVPHRNISKRDSLPLWFSYLCHNTASIVKGRLCR